jgi:preprotein translocase subunit SecG
MQTLITILHVLFALGLIAGVMLQSGRSAGLGAIAGGAERVFGKRKGMDDILARWTVVLSVGFFLSALVLTVVAG